MRIHLIHWNATEAREKIEQLQSLGYEVTCEPFDGQNAMRKLRENPPDVFVIDLSRLPSQGRDVAGGFRQYKDTRYVPIIFADGDPTKLARIQQLLPDTTFSSWEKIDDSIKQACVNPPKEPIVPGSRLAGYAGTPLPKKLGIKTNARVKLLNAPNDFEQTLGELPDGVRLINDFNQPGDLTIWFVQTETELKQGIEQIAASIGKDGLWIVWPKKAARIESDLTQNDVRQIGLATGLVDFKVCAIDADWAGLKFTRRKSK